MKDAVRAKDASGINNAVLAIIGESTAQLKVLREREKDRQGNNGKEVDLLEEVVDWGVRAFASYIRKSFLSVA